MEEIKSITEFIEHLKEDDFKDYQNYFHKPEDEFEFEIKAFKDFIQKRDILCKEIELVDGKNNVAKLKYKYKNRGETVERSDSTTWFPVKKSGNMWKISNKGEYLKSLAKSKNWRKIETPQITFYFDSFLKKTLDQINAENAVSELINLKKFLYMENDLKVSYFVYDDEKSLHELGFKSNVSGQDWIISNHPCDVFQLVSLFVKRNNPDIPKYLLNGFSAYYDFWISKSSSSIFNFSKQDFDRITFNSIRNGYYIKIKNLLNNLEFHKWTEMITIMSILSQQKSHPILMVFLTSSSFIKFLFENEVIGEIEEIRKKRILEILKTGKENDFENIFKKITGIKIKKAEKLWKKDLKIKSS